MTHSNDIPENEPVIAADPYDAPQPAPELETCEVCCGTGIAGHPDSGYTCHRCDGCGGIEPRPTPVDPYAALLPAPDREALVRLLQTITRNGSLDDGRTLHEVIADALLASGLRLPAPDDPYAALSQHLHGDGDAPTAESRLIASAAEAAVAAWRTRALAAEAEVERLRAAIPERDAEVRRAALEEAFAAIEEYPRAAPSEDEWMRYDEQIEHSQGIIRALIDAPPTAPDAIGKEVMPDASTRPIQQPDTSPRLTAGAHHACATPGCTNRPMIRLDDRRLCRDCYATHDFGDDA